MAVLFLCRFINDVGNNAATVNIRTDLGQVRTGLEERQEKLSKPGTRTAKYSEKLLPKYPLKILFNKLQDHYSFSSKVFYIINQPKLL
jgi:uncharacterized membrane-anchored protein YhcB (DUF1043 family)